MMVNRFIDGQCAEPPSRNQRARKTTRPLVICDPWDVVVVPFPFTDTAGAKRRPAVVLSEPDFNREGHSVLAMITSSTHVPWPGDVEISDLASAGLNVRCVVRLKIFTLDNRLLVRRLGHLAECDREGLASALPFVWSQCANDIAFVRPEHLRPQE